jgi:hypothetical protein
MLLQENKRQFKIKNFRNFSVQSKENKEFHENYSGTIRSFYCLGTLYVLLRVTLDFSDSTESTRQSQAAHFLLHAFDFI